MNNIFYYFSNRLLFHIYKPMKTCFHLLTSHAAQIYNKDFLMNKCQPHLFLWHMLCSLYAKLCCVRYQPGVAYNPLKHLCTKEIKFEP